MCGFAGFLSYSKRPPDAGERSGILAAMGRAIGHRGPDDEQFYDDDHLSLVFRRLAIVDAAGGRQPLFNEDRSRMIVVNGEVYNHRELRRELADRHRFSTVSDSEAMLHAFDAWGLDALPRCRGMYAAAVWEPGARCLHLIRDRLGIKPLYYCQVNEGVIFGSELKALLAHPDCPRAIHSGVLDLSPLSLEQTPTYVRGVFFVPAGASLSFRVENRSSHHARYWDLRNVMGSAPYGNSRERYEQALDELLDSAASEHLQGESPVALHLSGGLDSSMLAALAARHDHRISCYTIVERTTANVGDVTAAEACTRHLGLPWYPVLYDYRTLLDDQGFDLSCLEEAVWMMDSPRFDLEWLYKEMLTRTIRASQPDTKVVLLGQGADEFSGGYSNRIDSPGGSWSAYLDGEMREIRQSGGLDAEPFPLGAQTGLYHCVMQRHLRSLLHHNLWHEDRTSSWHGVEARVPFLDHRIVELLAAVPASLHESLFWDKRILRGSMQRICPGLSSQRPKVGFCWTKDTRSVEMVIHRMVVMVAPQFIEKYLDHPAGAALDRSTFLEKLNGVLRRAPGFFSQAFDLLQEMSRAIFKVQCEQARHRIVCERADRPCLPLLEGSLVGKVVRDFGAEPVCERQWRLDDRLEAQEKSEILVTHYADGQVKASLIQDKSVHAEIRFGHCAPWVPGLLRNLGKGLAAGFSIQDWMDEFDLPREVLSPVLNVLYQAGFVTIQEAALPLPDAFRRLAVAG